MNANAASVFQTTPFCKLLLSDVKRCKRNADKSWQITVELKKSVASVSFNNVWLQGYVRNISADGTSANLCDGNEKIKITDWSSVPGNIALITEGTYCLVLGHLDQVSPFPQMSALKVSNLSGNPLLRTIWPQEVHHLKQYLARRQLGNRKCINLDNKMNSKKCNVS